jgi:NAD dependent epimerase/dehydratase family enzyme
VEDDLQGQIDYLSNRVAANRAGIDALEARAEAVEDRADELEAHARVDRDMIAELQAEGVLSQEHAAQVKEALRSSRTVGTALGIIMASRHVGVDQAFAILSEASSRSHRKLREIAAELVQSMTADDPSTIDSTEDPPATPG